jgi:alpha-mannosidase
MLPNRWGFLEVSHANVVVSAPKPGDDGSAVLRVYEAAGQPEDTVTISFAAQVDSAEEVNLTEDPGAGLEATNNSVQFGLGPFEIKTTRLRWELRAVTAGSAPPSGL